MRNDLTILIVDDDDGHACLINKNLRRSGIDGEILRFKDGQEIIDFLFWGQRNQQREERSFVCLLDINLPGLSGIEVLARIKSDKQLCRMPVIMVTTTDDPGEIKRCYNIGCDGYIIKPVECGRFSELIRHFARSLEVMEIPQIKMEVLPTDDESCLLGSV